MKIAFYKGQSRLFNRFVSWKDSGEYSHCEAVFEVTARYLDRPYHQFECASASFLDGGVRFKNIDLSPDNWDVIDVPAFDESLCRKWFKDHEGEPYDVRGLINFMIPVGHNPCGWFCDEAYLASVGMPEPWRFSPNGLARICEFAGGQWLQGPSDNNQRKGVTDGQPA